MRDHIIIEDVFEEWECESIIDIFTNTPRVKFHQNNGGTEPIEPQPSTWRSDHGDKEVCWVPRHTDKYKTICMILKDKLPTHECYRQIRHVQIIKYPVNGLFHWHQDEADPADRATALITLNSDYTGGDLVVEDLTIRGKTGRMVSFNNSTKRWHTVSPILSGARFVLALWLGDGTLPLEGHDE